MDFAAGTDAGAVRDELIAALTAGDANLAEIIALDAVAEGMPVVDLYVDVIAPALAEIGHQWASRKLSVADEHLATGIAQDVMRLVSRTATAFPRRSRERVLLLAIGAENHVTGLRMIGDLAEARGFDVRYLGAALPVNTLAELVAKHRPEFVGISVTIAGSVPDLHAALDELAGADHTPRAVLVGGGAVPPALHDDPRVRYAPDAREALEILEGLADPV